MTPVTPTSVGVHGFIAALEEQGIPVERRGGLVVYRLEPLTGPAAGTEVETGIAVDELAGWPTTPPHWIHLPNSLSVSGGNGQPSEHPGWLRYSRPHPGRIDAAPAPGRAWVAHVRAFIGTAA